MVFIVILSSILLAVCTSVKPIYLQNAIDAVEAGADGALTLFGFYVASILGIMLFETVRQLSTGKYRNSVLFGLKKKVMAHIIHMPPRKFQEEQGQNYVTTLNNEIEMLVDSYYVTRLELAYSILVLITCVIALLYINSSLALIIIVATVCPIIASAVQGKALEKRTNFYTMALEKLNVMIGNLIHGYPTIKVNHVEQEYLATLERDNESAAKAEFAKSKTKIRVNMIIGLLSYAGEAVMVGFSIYEIARGRLSVGALVGALQLSEMLVIPTNSISYQISEMKSVESIRQKISSLLSVPESSAAAAEAAPSERNELSVVSFRHEERTSFPMSITALRRGRSTSFWVKTAAARVRSSSCSPVLNRSMRVAFPSTERTSGGCGPRFMMRLASSFRTRSSLTIPSFRTSRSIARNSKGASSL